jgi:hypothetical protein
MAVFTDGDVNMILRHPDNVDLVGKRRRFRIKEWVP